MNDQQYWFDIDNTYFQPKSTAKVLKLLKKNIQSIKKQCIQIHGDEQQQNELLQQEIELKNVLDQQNKQLSQLIQNILFKNDLSKQIPMTGQYEQIKSESFQQLNDIASEYNRQQNSNRQNLQQNNTQVQAQQLEEGNINSDINQKCSICLQKLEGVKNIDVHPLCLTLEINRKEQSIQINSPQKKKCCYCSSEEGCQLRFHQRCQINQNSGVQFFGIDPMTHLCKMEQ